jgi:hypothetical protein
MKILALVTMLAIVAATAFAEEALPTTLTQSKHMRGRQTDVVPRYVACSWAYARRGMLHREACDGHASPAHARISTSSMITRPITPDAFLRSVGAASGFYDDDGGVRPPRLKERYDSGMPRRSTVPFG